MNKTDPTLGRKVHEFLVEKGVETPATFATYSKANQIREISFHFKLIMETLGLDLNDDSLRDTANRVAKMYVHEIFAGLDYNNFPKCTAVANKMGYDELVLEKNVSCISSCEHHFVTIDQFAHIAYIPKDRVLGLSKLNRLAKFFAQRPQIQERFAEQLYWALVYILDTEDVAVIVNGKHYCVAQRGVEDTSSYTVTSKLGGCFKNEPDARRELMSLINTTQR